MLPLMNINKRSHGKDCSVFKTKDERERGVRDVYRDVKTEVAVEIDALAYLLSKESDKMPET